MIVLYEVNSAHDPAEEAGKNAREREVAAFRFEGTTLTLAGLRAEFPERGEFHFRAKVGLPAAASKQKPMAAYAWQDLVRDDLEIPRGPDGGPPHIRALPINYEDEDEDEDESSVEADEDYHADFFDDAEDSTTTSAAGAARANGFDFFSEHEGSTASATPPASTTPAPPSPPPAAADDGDDFDAFFSSSAPAQDAQDDPFSASSGEDDDDDEEEGEESSSEEGDDGSSDGSSASDAAHSSRRPSAGERKDRQSWQQREQEQQQQHRRTESDRDRGYFGSFGSSSGASGAASFGSSTFSFLKKSAQAAAMSFAGNKESTPTTQQKGALDNLSRRLRESFDPENREHVELLQTSWKSCFPKQRFERAGPQWRVLGFAKEDPARDRNFFKQNGMLGLYCLAYHLEHNRGAVDSARLPVAPSVGQINAHLADQFGLRSGAYLSAARPYWPLFDMGAGAYFELVSVTLRLAEKARPDAEDDGAALGRALEQVFAILSQGPSNIGAFYEIARANNILL